MSLVRLLFNVKMPTIFDKAASSAAFMIIWFESDNLSVGFSIFFASLWGFYDQLASVASWLCHNCRENDG